MDMQGDPQDRVRASFHALKQKHVDANIDWYHSRKRWNRWLHSGVAALTAILGVFVAFAVNEQSMLPKWTVSAAALALAIATALQNAFRWGEKWKVQTNAELRLRDAVATWEASMLQFSFEKNSDVARQGMVDATNSLLAINSVVVRAETDSFFGSARQEHETKSLPTVRAE